MNSGWVEDVEAGHMVGVMMIDLSAAFNMVDPSLLPDKLVWFYRVQDGIKDFTSWEPIKLTKYFA